jgi:hypothetical protein
LKGGCADSEVGGAYGTGLQWVGSLFAFYYWSGHSLVLRPDGLQSHPLGFVQRVVRQSYRGVDSLDDLLDLLSGRRHCGALGLGRCPLYGGCGLFVAPVPGTACARAGQIMADETSYLHSITYLNDGNVTILSYASP